MPPVVQQPACTMGTDADMHHGRERPGLRTYLVQHDDGGALPPARQRLGQAVEDGLRLRRHIHPHLGRLQLSRLSNLINSGQCAWQVCMADLPLTLMVDVSLRIESHLRIILDLRARPAGHFTMARDMLLAIRGAT